MTSVHLFWGNAACTHVTGTHETAGLCAVRLAQRKQSVVNKLCNLQIRHNEDEGTVSCLRNCIISIRE